MAIIFEPDPYKFFFKNFLGQFLQTIATLGVTDFVAEANKGWAYYLGAGLGGAAIATGQIQAIATVYVVGSALDATILQSPEGSNVDIFLDGVLYGSFSAYAGTNTWSVVAINMLDNFIHKIDFVNTGAAAGNETGISWMALGYPFTLSGGNPSIQNVRNIQMATTVVFRFKDDETNTSLDSQAFYLPDGFSVAEVQAWIDLVAPNIDDATGSQIVAIDIAFSATLPGSLKVAPVANAFNERGGLISFDTTGDRRESIRIPAILPSIMPGDDFSTADALIAPIITQMTTQITLANIQPLTPYGYQWVDAVRAKKSFRK